MTEQQTKNFEAFRIDQRNGQHHTKVETLTDDDLGEGELLIRTLYSSINYKDALAGTGQGKILRQFPLTGGIDVCGEVLSSSDSHFNEGDLVLVTGCGLSETRHGGYSQRARVESRWAVKLPHGLSPREAMILGTAGFTAALSLMRMEAAGQHPDMGPVVVTGATGGVGTLAIQIFTAAGYRVHAISSKDQEFEWLQQLGATQCISRHELHWGQRPLERATWAGAIDNVGGEMLEGLTRVIEPWGNIASCGMAGGMELHTTVMPFIIRGIGLLGINSAGCPYPMRRKIWNRLASDLKPPMLEQIATSEVTLDQLTPVFESMLAGQSRGRCLVRLND